MRSDLLIVVFSMNRACQLEAFLRSMKKFFKGHDPKSVNIIYKFTDENYEKGYNKVINQYPDFNYIFENDIRVDLRNVFTLNIDKKYAVFFCDDNIWKDEFDIDNDDAFKLFEQSENIVTLSLRMHPKVNKCYPMGNKPTPPPKFLNENPWIWNWVENYPETVNGDWGYYGSIDGHIFRMSMIFNHVMNLEYQNVNQVEAYFSANAPKHIPLMMCHEKSSIVNVPWNRVQTNCGNINMGIETKYINDEFLNGNVIDVEKFEGIFTTSPHEELNLIWKNNNEPNNLSDNRWVW
jgi:hypothetical protein